MSLVLAIVFGLWFLCIVILDKEKKLKKEENFKKNFPPEKRQEEYLLACKYYLDYLQDVNCQDKKGEALYRARMDIYSQGFLPTPLLTVGRDALEQKARDMRLPGFGIVINNPPDLERLEKLRRYDYMHLRPSLFHEFSPPYQEWEKYCDYIDHLYRDIKLQCDNHKLKQNHYQLKGGTPSVRSINIGAADQSDQEYDLPETHGIVEVLKGRVIDEAKQMTIDEFSERYKDSVFWKYRIWCKDYFITKLVLQENFSPQDAYPIQTAAQKMTVAEFEEQYYDTPYWRYRIYCRDYH